MLPNKLRGPFVQFCTFSKRWSICSCSVECLDSIWAYSYTCSVCWLHSHLGNNPKTGKWLEKSIVIGSFRIIQAKLIQQTDKHIQSNKKQLSVAQEVVHFALSSVDHLERWVYTLQGRSAHDWEMIILPKKCLTSNFLDNISWFKYRKWGHSFIEFLYFKPFLVRLGEVVIVCTCDMGNSAFCHGLLDCNNGMGENTSKQLHFVPILSMDDLCSCQIRCAFKIIE